MANKISPYFEVKYGWAYGEDGWNVGMDENLVKFSYLAQNNVNGIVSSLPAATTGSAYYLTTDNRIYFAIDGTYISFQVPKWFTFSLLDTGVKYRFDGNTVEVVPDSESLQNQVDSIQETVDSLGTSAFQDIGYFATPQNILSSRQAIESNYASANGSSLIGYSGRTIESRLKDVVNVLDVKAANPSFSWSQVFTAAQELLPVDPVNVGNRGGTVYIPPGNYLITGVVKKPGVVFQGSGLGTRIYNNDPGNYCFVSANTGGIQDIGGFRDILFDGGDPTSSSGASRIGFGAINIAYMHAGFAKNCVFQRFAERAISNQNNLSVKFEIDSCFFNGNHIAILLSDGMSTALHVNESYIAFNDFGILLTGQSDFHICNTIVEQNYNIGMRIDGTIDQGTIDNCYFEQNGAGAGGSKVSILVQGGKSVSINGTLFNMLGSAAGSSGPGWGHVYCGDLDNLSITDCTFNSGAGISGSDIQGASGATKPIVLKNVTSYSASTFNRVDSLAAARIAHVSTKVSIPTTSTTSGFPGQWAADTTYSYFYVGDGTTHQWRRVSLASW